jgi:hypothetical protein
MFEDVFVQDDLPALFLHFFPEEYFEVVKVLFFAEKFVELVWVGHLLDILLFNRELWSLIVLVMVESLLDFVWAGPKSINRQQMVGDMIMEATAVEIHVEPIMVLLQKLTSNPG